MNAKMLLRRQEGSLSKFLDKQVIDVLQVLDPNLTRPANLINLIEKTVDVHTMLKDQVKRNVLINAMNEKEAEEFAKAIGLKEWYDVKYALTKTTFNKNKLQHALKFFENDFYEDEVNDKVESEYISPEKPLFQHQIETVHSIREKLSTMPHKALLHMPTGSGKTLCAMRLIATHMLENPNTLVIWLAYSGELCEQALSEFKQMWQHVGDRKIGVYRFFGQSNLDPLLIKRGFIASSLSKMLGSAQKSNEFLAKMAKNVNLVVIDEAHQAIAPKFSIIIDVLSENQNTWLLGLSATPGRISGTTNQENIDLAKFFGQKKEILNTNGENPMKFLIKKGYLANPKFNPITHDGVHLSKEDIGRIEREIDVPKKILEKLSVDTRRNLAIVTEIMRLSNNHKKIIVFAASVKHAEIISSILAAKEYPSQYVVESTSNEVRSKILNDYRTPEKPMIICNYGILTTGFDVPQTSAVVIARPTKSHVLYAQMVGRGIRGPKSGGNKECEISTVMDNGIDEFFNIAKIFTMWEEVWNN